MLKVSIVVPTYNRSRLLRCAADSISAQTYQHIEIIIIDDGSTDGTEEICKELARDDSRIVLHRIDNLGVSAARNIGMELATGDMLMFCDSDDICCPTWVETLVYMTAGARGNLGVVGLGRFTGKPDNGTFLQLCTFEQEAERFSRRAFYELERRGILNPNVNKIYDLKVVRNHSLQFAENISNGEDLLFNLDYLRVMPGSIFLSEEVLYLVRTDTESSLSKQHRTRSWELSISLRSRIESLLNELNGTLEPYSREFYTTYLDLLERALADIALQYSSESFRKRSQRGNAILASAAASTAIDRADPKGRSLAYRLVLRSRRYELIRIYSFARRHFKSLGMGIRRN